MPMLIGLAGTNGKPRPVVYANSVRAFMRSIKKLNRCALTTAGENGAIAVWRDDDGKLRSECMRRMMSLNASTFDTKIALQAWLKEWLPRIQ